MMNTSYGNHVMFAQAMTWQAILEQLRHCQSGECNLWSNFVWLQDPQYWVPRPLCCAEYAEGSPPEWREENWVMVLPIWQDLTLEDSNGCSFYLNFVCVCVTKFVWSLLLWWRIHVFSSIIRISIQLALPKGSRAAQSVYLLFLDMYLHMHMSFTIVLDNTALLSH